MIAQISSNITASLRFDASLNSDLQEATTNLVQNPRMHFLVASYAPIVSSKKADNGSVNDYNEMTSACFSPGNQSVKCNLSSGV